MLIRININNKENNLFNLKRDIIILYKKLKNNNYQYILSKVN